MRIKEAMKEHGYTLVSVAKEIGVSQSSLSQSINNNPTASTLERIASVIGCEVGEFFSEGYKAKAVCPHCGKPINICLS